MEVKRFIRNEFEALFQRASEACLDRYITNFSDGNVHTKILWVISALKTGLLTRTQAIDHLLHKDGRFRPTIRLTPYAQTESVTVLDISWGDDIMDPKEWTEVLPSKQFRTAHEPFFIMTPDFNDLTPEDMERYKSGQPLVEKIILPPYKK